MIGRTPRRPLGLLIALPLLLGGCLLPQPDTPPIPPLGPSMASGKAGAPQRAAASPTPATPNNAGGLAEDANRAAPSAMPVPAATAASGAGAASPDQGVATNGAGGTTALAPASPGSEPPAFGATKAVPGRLAVTFTGDEVSEVWLESTTDGTGGGMPVTDDAFTVDLPAGEYILELTVGGKRLRTTKPVAVPAGGERTLAVRVEGGVITIEESVPLAEPSARPTPTPGASPTAP